MAQSDAPQPQLPAAYNSRRNPKAFIFLGIMLAAIAIILGLTHHAPRAGKPAPQMLYVSPSGSDDNSGTSEGLSLQTIQAALDKAHPGTTIRLAAGEYHEQITTKSDGTKDAPIVLQGPEKGLDKSGRYRAVLYNSKGGRVVSINNSYYRLDGFTIDGQEKLKDTPMPGSLAGLTAFKDHNQEKIADNRLLYIGADDNSKNITGILLSNMYLSKAGGECVRLRNNAYHNEIKDSVIEYCGLFGKDRGSDSFTYHNGEGVYIGTSPGSDDQPMHDNDGSSFNYIHDNSIHTFGSECFDVKENAHDNTLAANQCGYNAEPEDFEGSNIEVRGYNNRIIGNNITTSAGYGLKLRSDDNKYRQGKNVIMNNEFSGQTAATIVNHQNTPQKLVCGNQIASGGTVEGVSKQSATAQCTSQPPGPWDDL
jgi:hypothetical protein